MAELRRKPLDLQQECDAANNRSDWATLGEGGPHARNLDEVARENEAALRELITG